MKFLLLFVSFNVLLLTCRCEDKAVDESKDVKDEIVVLEVETADEDASKPKRQTEEGRAIGGGTQHIYGSAPGHYVLRTSPKEIGLESEADYLNILRQLESSNLQQTAAAQARPTVQQYLIPRQPQPTFASNVEQKYVQLQPTQSTKQRPAINFGQNLQAQYQNQRIPLVFRPSQPVRPNNGQNIYSSPGFFGNSAGHALHEARVQAALSVAEDKPTIGQSNNQAVFQFASKPQTALGDSSFEKELAQLVAANQAAELKAKPQAVQYIQSAQQKPSYTIVPSPKPKPYSFLRQDAQQPKYVAPSIRGKSPKLPQQYLIETTKPQQARPLLKAKPQYIFQQQQQSPQQQQQQQQHQQQLQQQQLQQQLQQQEEPKVYEYQSFQESPNPMKIVPAPQLHQSQAPPQYRLAQKESSESVVPAYLQYYQSIKPQGEEQVKLESYVPSYTGRKAQPSASTPTEDYIPKYQIQTKEEEPTNYVRYKAAKPQLSQYSSDDDSLIQTLLAQSLQKPKQAPTKTASSEVRPTLSAPSHSSIFVSKSLAPKKSHSVTIEQSEEAEEDIQTVRLPPPKNNKVYTQDEFQALLAAGYSVTPVPVTDDDESKPRFSPAPENYPGHSKYQSISSASPEIQTFQKQPSESYASVTQAPRTRKVQRRRPISQPRYRLQHEETQAESESQPQLSYALPIESERPSYGMRKQVRIRNQARQEDELREESES